MRADERILNFIFFTAVFFHTVNQDIHLFDELFVFFFQLFTGFLLLVVFMQQLFIGLFDNIQKIIDVICAVSAGKTCSSEARIYDIIQRDHANFLQIILKNLCAGQNGSP